MKRRLTAVLLCAVMAAGILAGCGDSGDKKAEEEKQGTTAQAGEKIFNYGTTAYGVEMGNTGLNPHDNYSGWSAVRYGVGETLFKFTENMELEPWLAESYEQVDEYTVKITLKDNIMFSSGRKMDGQAVKECLEDLVAVHDRAPGDLKIKVLGTKFNIEAYPDSETITTTLLEGSVEVESRLSRECIRMVPSQQLSYDIQSGEMKLSTISDSKEPVRWKDNVWVLHQTPFTQVCHRLEQMFNVKIVIMNDKFIGKKFTGEFRFGDSLESILEVIRITTPFTYEREEDTIILK